MRKIVLIAALFVTVTSLGACSNTLSGVERDMNKVGGEIKDTFPPKHA